MLTQLRTALDNVVTPVVCNYHPNVDRFRCTAYTASRWIEQNPDTVNLIAVAILIPITVMTFIAVYDTFARD